MDVLAVVVLWALCFAGGWAAGGRWGYMAVPFAALVAALFMYAATSALGVAT